MEIHVPNLTWSKDQSIHTTDIDGTMPIKSGSKSNNELHQGTTPSS
jgi:hypothetical protein